jgi:hypothetical protein
VNLKSIFTSDPARHEGVRPIHIFLLRVIYLLMCALMARTAWANILGHQGAWEPYQAMCDSVWAAYGTLALLGLLHPLRMLPIVLFMIFYKSVWLAVVALPLVRSGTLAGSPAEELTYIFLAAPAFALCVPWGYVMRQFVLPKRAAAAAVRPAGVRAA